MPSPPCLNIAISHLSHSSDNLAVWVIQSPLPRASVFHDSPWSDRLTRQWLAWQEMFSTSLDHHLPYPFEAQHQSPLDLSESNPAESYGGRLMQALGVELWHWIFANTIGQSFAQSRGLAMGKQQPLRLRLEIQAPNLIPLPWEIMQQEVGTQAIALHPQILFSRTISNVDSLAPHISRDSINILLVLGEKSAQEAKSSLNLPQEANLISEIIENHYQVQQSSPRLTSSVTLRVQSLIQPTPAQLIEALDTGIYNVIFYAGHGMPDPDGGKLFLAPNTVMNGTELAQTLIRNRITLAVFNACWGAKPAQQDSRVIERSSLAEVLIHHGVPAVLAMRDSIADEEALEFIKGFTTELMGRIPIDKAMQRARQKLLTLYGFNQPAWTLPILYMHPEFDGELVPPVDQEGITVLPNLDEDIAGDPYPVAYFRPLNRRDQQWRMYGGSMKIGRVKDNDLVIPESWVSRYHAEVICRVEDNAKYTHILKDNSSYGTFISNSGEWQTVHHQEIKLESGIKLRFGSTEGQIFEFVVENYSSASSN